MEVYDIRSYQAKVKEQAEQIKQLEETLDDYHNAEKMALISPCDEVHCSCVPLLLKRIKELEELLIEYGRHRAGCSKQWGDKYPCSCGWDREREQSLKGK